jgi:hypothetical protein
LRCRTRDTLQNHLDTANKQVLKTTKQLEALRSERETECTQYRALIKELQSRAKPTEPASPTNTDELQAKVSELQAEVALLTKQMLISHQSWVDENYNSTSSLRGVQADADEARVKYYEAMKELKVLRQRVVIEESPVPGTFTRFRKSLIGLREALG